MIATSNDYSSYSFLNFALIARAERVVQRSEARLRLFMDTATDYFYLYDSNLNLIDVNESGMIIFPHATSKEDVLGKNMLELIPGLEGTGRYEKYKEVVETGNPVFFDSIKIYTSVSEFDIGIKAFKAGDGLGIHCFNLTGQRLVEKRFETLHSHAAELATATTLVEVAEKTFEAIGKTLEVDLGARADTLNITEVDLPQLISDSLATSLIPSGVTVEVNADPMKHGLDRVKMR